MKVICFHSPFPPKQIHLVKSVILLQDKSPPFRWGPWSSNLKSGQSIKNSLLGQAGKHLLLFVRSKGINWKDSNKRIIKRTSFSRSYINIMEVKFFFCWRLTLSILCHLRRMNFLFSIMDCVGMCVIYGVIFTKDVSESYWCLFRQEGKHSNRNQFYHAVNAMAKPRLVYLYLLLLNNKRVYYLPYKARQTCLFDYLWINQIFLIYMTRDKFVNCFIDVTTSYLLSNN